MVTVLIAEDDELILEIVERYLSISGYRTIRAKNGVEVLDTVTRQRPDVIIMDLGMPKMSGVEATRRLKGDPATSTIPIIALTAYAFADDRHQALEAGCDEFETKPISFEQLLSKIRRLTQAAA